MVDVEIYDECCPKCDEDCECYDEVNDEAFMRCLKCGYEFEIEKLWILRC